MQVLSVPGYCLALLQPHAALLYWASTAATQLGLQATPLGQPRTLSRLGNSPKSTLPHIAHENSSSSSQVSTNLNDHFLGEATHSDACNHQQAEPRSSSAALAAGEGPQPSEHGKEMQAPAPGSAVAVEVDTEGGVLAGDVRQDAQLLVMLAGLFHEQGKPGAAAVCYRRAIDAASRELHVGREDGGPVLVDQGHWRKQAIAGAGR